jgi:hypothetical protein
MGVLLFNIQGLMGTLGFGLGLLFLVNHLENTAQIGRGNGLALIVIGTTFLSSLYGFTVDRTDRRGIIRPYWDNWRQVCYDALRQSPTAGFKYNPSRRTAVFFWPLALGPYCLLALLVPYWLYTRVGHAGFLWRGLLPRLILYSMVSCVAATIYGAVTQDHRLIEGQQE